MIVGLFYTVLCVSLNFYGLILPTSIPTLLYSSQLDIPPSQKLHQICELFLLIYILFPDTYLLEPLFHELQIGFLCAGFGEKLSP